RVLGLQGPQPTRLGHLETAELGLPLVERRRADPMLAAQIGRWQPGLLLVQHADDLLLREPRLPHPSASCSGGLYSNLEEIQGLRSIPVRCVTGGKGGGSTSPSRPNERPKLGLYRHPRRDMLSTTR